MILNLTDIDGVAFSLSAAIIERKCEMTEPRRDLSCPLVNRCRWQISRRYWPRMDLLRPT